MISELSEIAESRQQRGHKWSGQPIEFQNEKKGNRLLFDPMVFFFPCIAGRVRDMVGQLLEIRMGLKAN